MRRADDAQAVEWQVLPGLSPYEDTVRAMEARAEAIAAGEAPEAVWLLEHPALYTAGTSERAPLDGSALPHPLHRTGRGGQTTYHGPGQRVAYAMLDLNARGRDLRAYVSALEGWLVDALERFNVRAEPRPDRVGVWVKRPDKGEGYEDKIAAIGVRVRRWVAFHGIALNVEPDLEDFRPITPCGIADARYGVTSLAALGQIVSMEEADMALRAAFEARFGPTRPIVPGAPDGA